MSEATVLEAQEDRLRIGQRVIEARELAQLTQRALAVRLVKRRGKHAPDSVPFERAVSSMQRTLRRTENGHNMPRGDLLLAIAEETGVPAGHFTADKPEENDELRRRAKEMLAPFQRGNGRRAVHGMPKGRGRARGSA